MKTVIVRLQGGLGNQLFQYAMGRRVALKTRARLKFDNSWFNTGFAIQGKRYYGLSHFNIQAELADVEEVSRYTSDANSRNKIIERLRQMRLFGRPKHIVEHSSVVDPDMFMLSGNVYLDGFWQSEAYFKSIERDIRSDLAFKRDAAGRNADLARQILSDCSVSAHIRRGDYVSNPIHRQFHGLCSLDYYRTALGVLREYAKEFSLYVFSDDPLWAKDNVKVECPVTFVDINADSDGHEDMRLMSLCRHHIIANSTFSWWGAWLSAFPDKKVIAPRRWFADEKMDDRDIVPKEWMRV